MTSDQRAETPGGPVRGSSGAEAVEPRRPAPSGASFPGATPDCGAEGLSPACMDALVEHDAEAAAPWLSRWLDRAALRRNLRDAIEALLKPASLAPAPAAAFASPAAGPQAGDRAAPTAVLVTWRPDAHALVEPRHRADGRPLLHAIVWHRTADPADADDLERLRAAVVSALTPLPIERVCLHVHGPHPAGPAFSGHGTVRAYKRYLASSMAEVLAKPPPPQSERVRVSTPHDLAFYPAYAQMYRDFWAGTPSLGQSIGMESPEEMEGYLAGGGLRLVHVDGQLAGVIAAVRHVEVGLRGWRLRERVMDGRHRGGGFAAAALWRYLHDLPHEPGDLIWGTILVENKASLRSAQKVGRVDVGGLVWVDPM